jgi:hypothetical protein
LPAKERERKNLTQRRKGAKAQRVLNEGDKQRLLNELLFLCVLAALRLCVKFSPLFAGDVF